LSWDEQQTIKHVYLGSSYPESVYVGVVEICQEGGLAKKDQEK
jgi:hypothetical protein